jgi:hypothetical protein
MSERLARGSMNGILQDRPDGRPCVTGTFTVEQPLSPGDKLRVAGWLRTAAGVEFLSVGVSRAAQKGVKYQMGTASGKTTDHRH